MMHDWIGTALTIATVFATSAFGISAVHRLEDRMDKRFEQAERRYERVADELKAIREDLREFYAEQRVHDSRITTLENKR